MRAPPSRVFVVAVLLALSSACSGALPRPRYMAQPTSALVPVPLPPPPARVELVPPSPAKGAVWVDGEWLFRHGRWAWSLGYWTVAPPGALFSPWTDVRTADGALLHAPGTWRDAEGHVLSTPPPLAVASAQSGPVVDSEGVNETTGRSVRPGTEPPGAPAPAPAEAAQPAPPAQAPAPAP